jgi:hypothetical protein
VSTKRFDLNIERVLEHWSVAHAIREVIANALDEQALTGSKELIIFKDGRERWHIRDWGRGLRYDHLTQNENKEKLAHPKLVIGKFGVGLKDAFATFDRHSIRVTVHSLHSDITIAKEHKHGFEDLSTLHALISPASDPAMVGTDVILEGVSDEEIAEAKSFFLRYSDDELLEHTTVGDVLRRAKKEARIYVNGLRVAGEPNFLFSYNITAPTKGLRQALNRERSHVGRSAYTDRVKAILLACEGAGVADILAKDLASFGAGTMHDELQWIDVSLHACRILNSKQQVIFLTPSELAEARSFVDHARSDGYRVIVVPDNIRQKLPVLTDLSGVPIRDLTHYRQEWDQSFQFSFVPVEQLTSGERAIWEKTDAIFLLAGGRPRYLRDVLISETMRLQQQGYSEAAGVWDPGDQRIIIKRSQLADLAEYAGTLLHELVHARSGADDVSMAFEDALTRELGNIVACQLQRGEQDNDLKEVRDR